LYKLRQEIYKQNDVDIKGDEQKWFEAQKKKDTKYGSPAEYILGF